MNFSKTEIDLFDYEGYEVGEPVLRCPKCLHFLMNDLPDVSEEVKLSILSKHTCKSGPRKVVSHDCGED